MPELLVLTDRLACAEAGRSLQATLARALEGGPFSILVREKDLPPSARARLVVEAMELAHPLGARVLVASDAALAHRLGADGVHLGASDPLPGLPAPLVGRSCHDDLELGAARAEGVGYATLSPVLPSTSKPDYGPTLGAGGLAAAIAGARGLPVVALGGIGPGAVEACLGSGAAGVAVMGAVMRSPDPAATVSEIRAAIDRSLSPSTASGVVARSA